MLHLRASLCLVLAAPFAAAQVELQKFTADAPVWGEELGSVVDVDGNLLALSRPGADVGGISDCGSIQLYRWAAGAWTLEQEVVAPDAEPWDQLGSCALQGDLLVAGARLDDVGGAADAGSVHVFLRSDGVWVQVQTLFAPDGQADDHFGWRVALDGDLLVVGAPQADAPLEPDRGKAYVFRRTAGAFAWEGTLSGTGSDALFGHAVAVDDEVIAVGAPGTEDFGRAYVCRKPLSSWSIQQAFDAPFGSVAGVQFGRAVALRDGFLAVGGPKYQTQGVVSTYREVGASFEHVVNLSFTDPVNDADFGAAVDLSGGWIAIGCPGGNGSAIGLGALYLHRWNPSTLQWGAEFKLHGGPADIWADLGSAVAIDGPLAVGGAPTEKLVATAFEGSATVFSIMNPVWSFAGGGLPGVHGVPGLIGVGTLQPATPVQLALRDARESAPGALFVGTSLLEAPFKGGTLVPAPTLVFFLTTNAAGELTLSTTWPGAILSGATLWMQAWIADPAAVAGWSASNAVSATQP
jgi:hypothetical protein